MAEGKSRDGIARRAFIKQAGLSGMGLGWAGHLAFASLVRGNNLPVHLPRSAPELQAVSSEAILRFLDAIRDIGQQFHSLMILRHGHVIAEGWWAPYSADHKQQLYSLSKSFTGTAIGLLVGEGRLMPQDQVIKFYPSLLPKQVSENLAALQVRHLLSMSVGHAKDSILLLEASPPGVTWEETFLNLPVVFPPGSQFMYNSGASFMLSSIAKQVTGQTAHEYLKPRLYDPMDIVGATWTENFEGINMGASHLRMRTEDLAKFGQLYLQQGRWNGKQLISQNWVMEATSRQMVNGKNDSSWGCGYGFQFWLNPPGGFRADGAFGQFSIVLPKQDAVVVITSESISTKDTLQIVWDVLVPEMKELSLPGNSAGYRLLQQKLSSLAYNPPAERAHSLTETRIGGKQFILDKNPFNAESIQFTFADDHCDFTLKEMGKPDIRIRCGLNHWITAGNYKPEPHSLFSLRRIDFDSIVAASATWKNDTTLLLTWRFIETVHGDSLTFLFEGDQVTLKFLFSVAQLQNKPDDRADIKGIVAS